MKSKYILQAVRVKNISAIGDIALLVIHVVTVNCIFQRAKIPLITNCYYIVKQKRNALDELRGKAIKIILAPL